MKALMASSMIVLLATGCTGMTHSFKEYAPTSEGPTSALIDIKQRAILSSKRKLGQSDEKTLILCAEPSPDALSSISFDASGDLKKAEVAEAGFRLGVQEAASYIGLRTQTIQLLRDGMYRLCEGYLSGSVSGAEYAWMMRRYQKYMVALLSIEQLTRVTQAPAVSHVPSNPTAVLHAVKALHAELKNVDEEVRGLEREVRELEARKAAAEKLPDAEAKAAELAKIEPVLSAKRGELARSREIRAVFEEGIRNAGKSLTGGSAVVVTAAPSSGYAVQSAVVGEIGKIVREVLSQDDLGSLCFQVLEGSRGTTEAGRQKSKAPQAKTAAADAKTEAVDAKTGAGSESGSLFETCKTLFDERNAALKARTKLLNAATASMQATDVSEARQIRWMELAKLLLQGGGLPADSGLSVHNVPSPGM